MKNYILSSNTQENNFKEGFGISNEDMLKLYEKYSSDIKTTTREGEVVEGTVTHISKKGEAFIDFGYRQMGIVELVKEKQEINVGDSLSFLVKSVKGEDIYLSYEEYLKHNIKEEMLDSIYYNKKFYKSITTKEADNITFYDGKIVSIWNKAGFVVDVNGVSCFMPGSLTGINKMYDFESMLGKTIKVAPVNFDQNNIVVSGKLYLLTQVPKEIEKLVIGSKIYEGTVTGCSNFGVFVKFNEVLTGMIYHSELVGEDKEKFDKKLISENSTIKFRIKNIDKQKNNKIVLTQKEEDDWTKEVNKLNVNTFVEVEVIKYIGKPGYLVSISPNVRGVLKTPKRYNQGDTIKNATITGINKSSRKIFLEEMTLQ